MSKKKIGLYPNDVSFRLESETVKVIEIKDNSALIYKESTYGAQGLIPFSRFLKEEECSRVQVNSEIVINRYYSTLGRRLLAYHARYES